MLGRTPEPGVDARRAGVPKASGAAGRSLQCDVDAVRLPARHAAARAPGWARPCVPPRSLAARSVWKPPPRRRDSVRARHSVSPSFSAAQPGGAANPARDFPARGRPPLPAAFIGPRVRWESGPSPPRSVLSTSPAPERTRPASRPRSVTSMAEQSGFFEHTLDEFILSVRDVRFTQLMSCKWPRPSRARVRGLTFSPQSWS